MLRTVTTMVLAGLVLAAVGGAQAAPIAPLPAGSITAALNNLTDVSWRSCWRDRWGRMHCRRCWRDSRGRVHCR